MDLPDEIKYLQQQTIDKHSDARANDSGDSDSDRDDIPHTDHPEQLLAEQPAMRNAGNTGVKGVLADYAEAKENLRLKNQMDKAEAMRKIEKMAITVGNSNSNNNNNVDEDEDDEEFMKMYRQKRLAEMQQASRPTFGYLRAIDSSEYVDAIEKEAKDVFVVVHLYKNEFKTCVKLNLILQNLAIKYPFVKFMKIISTEALPKYDDVGLPTLLVYQGGDLVHRWVPITSKIGNNFDSEDVELLLAKGKVIKTNLIDKTTMLHKEKAKDIMQEYDDDDFSDNASDEEN
eukprot:Phypoly_transcript_13404.p1 GENE.Phypoly_transcript_13404~~Phypoly_transcript_13404.p1  ORF type:complete len:301 (+),score=70.42 Phypoly_transcript_13404:45-905(+)